MKNPKIEMARRFLPYQWRNDEGLAPLNRGGRNVDRAKQVPPDRLGVFHQPVKHCIFLEQSRRAPNLKQMTFVDRSISDRTAVCTIVARNYLGQARTLFSSIKDTQSEGIDFFVLILDQPSTSPSTDDINFHQLDIHALNIPPLVLEDMKFRYNVVEFATAVKPALLNYFLLDKGYSKTIYFDPDILVVGPLHELIAQLNEASMILTPHILESPPEDGCRPTEREILISGCFNLGFIGVRKDDRALRFLDWWETQLRTSCLWRPEQGLFVDQRWLDLAPGLVDGLRILRNPGDNVAFWNLHERRLSYENGRYLANGHQLTFFHFSGFNPRKPNELSRHQTRHRIEGVLGDIVQKYVLELEKSQYESFADIPYLFDFWDNGIKIPTIARRLFLRLQSSKKFEKLFATFGTESFFSWMLFSEGQLPPLLQEIWRERVDLQKAFPDPASRDRESFISWANERAMPEYQLDQKLNFLLELSCRNIRTESRQNLLIGENHFARKMPSHH